jgi:hypothetical protein
MMIHFDFPTSLPKRQVETVDDLSSVMSGMSDVEWRSGSGMPCLVSDRTKSSVSIIKHPHEPLYILVSAREPGTDEIVFVQSDEYTAPVSLFIGGNEINYPKQFFHGWDRVKNVFDEFISNGSIDYGSDWKVLHLQEWDGMIEY